MSKRVIADIGDGSLEPTVIAIGALHGNEPAGVEAITQISRLLKKRAVKTKGRFIGLTGNLSALAANTRYLDEDLNRIWTENRITADTLRSKTQPLTTEHAECEVLLSILRAVKANAQDVYVVDLHTTSAETAPFAWVVSGSKDEAILSHLELPLVYDGIQRIPGTFVSCMAKAGFTSVCVEGGSHTHPDSADNLSAVLAVVLQATGCINGEDLEPELARAQALLRNRTSALPKEVEIFYHHRFDPNDQFEMEPGFTNFEPITKSQLLAHDKNGVILADQNCRLLMPLYQSLGEDGFLLIREKK